MVKDALVIRRRILDEGEAAGQADVPGLPVAVADQAGPISQAIFRLGRFHRTVAADLLREIGLFPGQELVLMELAEHREMRQAELISELGLDPSTITKSLNRMEANGLVRRRPSKDDRRAMVVTLTPGGRALCPEVIKVWAELERRTTADMSASFRATLLAALRAAEDNLVRGRAAT